MEPVIQRIEAVPEHTVEVVVHISETLEEQQRNNMIVALENDDRIYSVEFIPSRCHLMLVKYDRDQYSSADVLSSITSRNVSAKLIGPV
jgi:hypothetical protein